MESIAATQPHYVRCIKPNYSKKPNAFDEISVLKQLRCGGVMEQVRISSAGYPSRYYSFLAFVEFFVFYFPFYFLHFF